MVSLQSVTPPSSTVPDDAHAARRKYKKDLDFLKPNLAEYKKQRELAMGGITSFNPQASSSQVRHFLLHPLDCCTEYHAKVTVSSYEQQLAADNLYRDANTLIYGDSKPSEDAIDRVVEKINKEYVCRPATYTDSPTLHSIDKKSKFSRKRPHQDEGDITYINEHNRVFNKKVIPASYISECHPHFISRLHDTTTSTQRKSGQASSVVQHYSSRASIMGSIHTYIFIVAEWLIWEK
jgi:hypothetical protein